MSKIRLGFSSYTYARVSVMKGDLIRSEEWPRLMGMGPHEVLRYLQDGGYKEEIDHLGTRFDLVDIEHALNRNLARTFRKLRRISDDKLRIVIDRYLMRNDIENFKLIIRGKMTGSSNQEIENLFIPSVNYPLDYFRDLLKLPDIGSIVSKLPFKVEGTALEELDGSLQRAYYTDLLDLAKNLRGQGEAMSKFIEAELEAVNIRTIVRLKQDGRNLSEITPHLIDARSHVLQLAELATLREVIVRLHRMDLVSSPESLSDHDVLVHIETELGMNILRKEILLMHQHPLTVNVILGFMFVKEIEVRNLKVLIKGKKLGLDEHYLRSLMVVA